MASPRPLVVRAFGAAGAGGIPSWHQSPPPRADDSDPVVARANGVDIRQSDLALAEEEVGGNMPQMPPEQKRDYLITYLADVIILSQAAEQQKLGDRDDVKRRVAFERNKVLMEALLQDAGQAAHDRRCDAQGLRRGRQADGDRAGGARAPYPGADRGRGQGDRS